MIRKKVLTAALAAAFAMSAFTGCGQNAQSTPTASSKAADVSKTTSSSAASTVTEEVDAEGFRILAAPETVSPTVPLNVRKAPGFDAEILGVASKGATLTRTAVKEGWSRVEYNGGIGYVASEYLTAGAGPAENPPEESRPAESRGTESQNTEGQGTESQNTESQGTESTQPSAGGQPDYSAYMNWDLSSLSNDLVPFGYDNNDRDERNIPNGWNYYESLWGEFNVDYIGDTSKNVIYLTMDEGYANTNTEKILDTLAAKGVKAVFFVTWNFVTERPDLVRRMIDEGHMLGNHTVSHKSMSTLSIEEQTKEVMDLENHVLDNFGYKMVLFRYPEGAFSKQSMGLINNLGFKVSFWSYAYNDYSEEQMPVPEALQKALDSVHPGAIYLLHAKSDTNTAMLADFIDGVRAKGFEFGVYDLTAK